MKESIEAGLKLKRWNEKKMKEAEFYKKKLGNGLRVLFEKRQIPVVAVSSAVNYGSAFESEGIKGTAHFLEHLMFKGTKTRGHQEIAEEIEKKGGIINAYTEEEVTCYWNKLPSKHLASGINIASDLNLNPKFDPVEFEREKNVILEEINMYHDNPVYHVYDEIKALLYKKPFGTSIAGHKQVIKNISREKIKNIFEKNYSTDEMILTVVGKADFQEILNMAEKLYPATKRSKIFYKPEKMNLDKVERRKGLEQAHFILGFHSPSAMQKEKYAYEVAGAWLFGGMSSRLFQEIREKRGLAYAVKGAYGLGKNYGYGTIYTGTLKEKIKQIKEIILKEIKNLKNLEKKDFEECKEQLIGAWKIEAEDSVNTMNSLLMEEIFGNAEEYYKYEEKIEEVKLKEIKNIKLRGYSCFSLIPG